MLDQHFLELEGDLGEANDFTQLVTWLAAKTQDTWLVNVIYGNASFTPSYQQDSNGEERKDLEWIRDRCFKVEN